MNRGAVQAAWFERTWNLSRRRAEVPRPWPRAAIRADAVRRRDVVEAGFVTGTVRPRARSASGWTTSS
ncbi:hypothetical protein [Lysobacter gummosus]|uniref:hypothetical protein n=1 Tax=Lysobacter gummosus TaxID=262324 RepID=UPI00362E6A9E